MRCNNRIHLTRSCWLALAIVILSAPYSSSQQIQAPRAANQQPDSPLELRSSDDAVRNAALALTTTDVDQIVEAANADVGLAEEGKARVADLADDIKSHLARAQQFSAQADEFHGLRSTIANRKASAQQLLDQLEQFEPRPTSGQQLSELELELEQRKSGLEKLKERQAELESQATTRGNRRTEIRRRLDEIETSQTQLRQLLAVPPAASDDKSIARLKAIEALGRFQSNEFESKALSAELAMFDAETAADLFQVERNLNARQLSIVTEEVQLATSAVQEKRRAAAETLLEEAEKVEEAVDEQDSPWLRSVTKRNRELAERNSALESKIASIESRLNSATNRLQDWEGRFSVTKDKVDSVGLPASMGAMLRQLRTNLPSERKLRSAIRARRPLIEQSQLDQFDLADERARLDDIDKEIDVVLRELPPQDESVTQAAQTEIRRSLENRLTILDALYKNETIYFQHLTDFDFAEEKLANISHEFGDYIKENVLWVRSEPSLISAIAKPRTHAEAVVQTSDRSLSDWENLTEAWANSQSWSEFASSLWQDVKFNPFIYIAAAILFGALFVSRFLFATRLQRIADRTRSSSYSRFLPTIHSATITIVASILVPAMFLFVAWRCGQVSVGEDIAGAISIAAKLAGYVLLPIAMLKQVYRHNGLADAHFDVPLRTLKVIRGNLRWFPFVFVPLMLLGIMAKATSSPVSGGVVYRLFFIGSCLVASVFLWRVFNPQQGIVSEYLSQHRDGWFDRLQSFWFWGCVLAPVGLAVLSGIGYAYSAQVIAQRLFLSITVGALLLVLRGLLMRLLLVYRRKLSIEQARARYEEFEKRRAEAIENGEDGSAMSLGGSNLPGVGVTSDGIVVEEDPLAELRANTAQSRRLLSTMFLGAAAIAAWMIWSDILPAFGFLERWPLWNSTQQVADIVTNEQGLREIEKSEIIDPVTVPDLLIALLISGISLVSARDLPGLLEIAILKRLPLERSTRYAVTTLSRYAIALLGLIFACRWVGLHWHQVQWMATALTFGLAFGLQEMFANFVAGVIILFERPVRVGDIVTIDDVTGVVSRVRIRATTVTNWDRKDYIVPNKDFITGRLLNWTLSDKVNRIVVEVGVAYGTDTAAAKQLLVDVATEHPIVVIDPAPMATFEEFGDSTLKLVLRCFISMKDMPMRLNVVDELHSRIDHEFAKAGIEIAFPQQDVHVRQMPAATK